MSVSLPTLTAWLVQCTVGGSIVLFIAAVLMARTCQPALKQRLGEWGLASALAVALLSLLPAWFVLPVNVSGVVSPPGTGGARAAPTAAIEPAIAAAGEAVDLDVAFVPALGDVPLPAPPPEPAAAAAAAAPDLLGSVLTVGLWLVVAAYAAGLVLFLARLALAFVALQRIVGRSDAVPLPVQRLFAEMLPRGAAPRLLLARGLEVPISFGLLRPTIILPARLCARLDAVQLRWVLRHELTHLERRDAWSSLLCAVAQAVYFFLPLCWTICRQVRLCQEYIADASAVSEDQEAEYAEFLLTLTRSPAPPRVATGVSGISSDLYRRVTMLVQKPIRVERSCSRRWLLGAGAALLTLSVLVSGVSLADSGRAVLVITGDGPPKEDNTVRAVRAVRVAEDPAADTKERHVIVRNQARFAAPPDSKELDEALKRLERVLKKEDMDRIRNAVKEALQKADSARDDYKKAMEQWRFQLPLLVYLYMSSGDRLGVEIDRPSPALADQLNLSREEGIVITRVLKDSPAEKAGLKVNDILVRFANQAVPSDPEAFFRLVGKLEAKKPFDAEVIRKGRRETIRGIELLETKRVVQATPFLSPQANAFGHIVRGNVLTTVMRTNDRFTARHQEGSLIITVTGKVAGGKANAEQIQVQDGGKTNSYNAVGDVPAAYRDKVNNLLDMVSRGHIEIRRNDP